MAVDKGGGGKTLIHRRWIKYSFFFLSLPLCPYVFMFFYVLMFFLCELANLGTSEGTRHLKTRGTLRHQEPWLVPCACRRRTRLGHSTFGVASWWDS